jgi:phosphoglycerate kinase
MKINLISDLLLEGKKIFLRQDLNVPLGAEREILDDSKIQASLRTIKYGLENGGALILASHLGRPKGKIRKELSLEPIGTRLAELLDKEIIFSQECIGDGARFLISQLKQGEIILLENLRFHQEEEKNEPEFAKALSQGVDIYINDAFACAHRAHASIVGITQYISEKGQGFLMEEEIKALEKLLKPTEHPYVLVLGGAKVSDKIGIIKNLLSRLDIILIGGAMANTFLKAKGIEVGESKVENESLSIANEIMDISKRLGVELVVPKDVVVSSSSDREKGKAVSLGEISQDEIIADIGPETVECFKERIKKARTIFWNGPMGIYEKEAFRFGTQEVAKAIVESTCFSVVGGGDSVSAIKTLGFKEGFSYISTGGGASLEFLEKGTLPGIEALKIKEIR